MKAVELSLMVTQQREKNHHYNSIIYTGDLVVMLGGPLYKLDILYCTFFHVNINTWGKGLSWLRKTIIWQVLWMNNVVQCSMYT
jgi:hypothetical protein